MNVLITGITGMIGSGFATETQKRGWNTYGVARSSAASRLAAVDQENVFRCDILDLEAMTAVFEETKPDIVIHMAAQAFNGMSWKAEITTHNTNLFGTRNVLYCGTTPTRTTFIPWPTTIPSTSFEPAPRAMRIPISRVRRETA